MKKKKTKAVYPKCAGYECGIELRSYPNLDPHRTLCVMCALEQGVKIELSPKE